MGSCEAEAEAEAEQRSTPRLALLFNVPPMLMQSPERSGMLTPPLHTSASVPFRWEEEPGKPRPCTALVPSSNPTHFSSPKCLELPPRLLLDAKLTKLPSPATVLVEGAYVGSSSSSNRFGSPSFRMSEDCYGSFNAERAKLGALVLSQRVGISEKGWFGSWRKVVKRDVSRGSHVFPSSADRETADDFGSIGGSHNKMKITKMKRSGSFSNLFRVKSRLWTTISEGLKKVVPRRSKK